MQTKIKRRIQTMETIGNKYVVECTSGGEYYAYLLNHEQCCAFGETAEEAIENLEEAAEEFFSEINSVFYIEDIA